MSIRSASDQNPNLPFEIIESEVFPHLRGTGDESDVDGFRGDQTIGRLAFVCRRLLESPKLTRAREAARTRILTIFRVLNDFPLLILDIFKMAGRSMAFLSSAATASVSRFKKLEDNDSIGPGIQFNLCLRGGTGQVIGAFRMGKLNEAIPFSTLLKHADGRKSRWQCFSEPYHLQLKLPPLPKEGDQTKEKKFSDTIVALLQDNHPQFTLGTPQILIEEEIGGR